MARAKKSSPMMQQYQQAKQACQDALLLFRMGDFYELFYEDANIAARELGLTLTSRDKNTDNPIPMAGFPHHQLDGYLARLIHSGHRVAVCEQVEDPATAKGLVKREVTRVVSPGTITDHELLDPRQSNYLAAIVDSKTTGRSSTNPDAGDRSFGLAWIDVSTGEFVICQIDSKQLGDLLARLCPTEILLPDTFDQPLPEFAWKPAMTRQVDWATGFKHAHDALIRHFKVASLDGFGIDTEARAAIRAAGGILHYIGENQADVLDFIDSVVPWYPGESMEIDQATWRSLEITRTIRNNQRDGSLFDVMDRTVSSMGSRQLATWLAQPLTDLSAIRARHDAVDDLLQHSSARKQFREQLKSVYDIQRLLARLSSGRATPRDLSSIGMTLETVPLIERALSQCDRSQVGQLRDGLQRCESLHQVLKEALEDDCPISAREGGLIRAGFDEDLDRFRELSSGGKKWIADYQAKISTESGIPSIKVGYNKVFGYYLEVTNVHRDKVPDTFVRKQTLKNAERYITPELKEYEERVLSADQQSLDREYELFCRLRERAAEHLPQLKQNASTIAQLDALAGLAEFASENNYVRPEMTGESIVDIQEGRHPVLDVTQPLGSFVPNSTRLDEENGLIHLITGPNMAGKSTYIRQVALIVLMAHAGSFVPATSARIGLTDRMFARVGASDELSRGQSTFMVEMIETARILNTATPRSLVILDEIGRGTSTYDGVSLAWAIVEFLHESVGCRTMFATHYHELTKLDETLSSVANYNVVVREWNDEIVFLHQIEKGAADKSYGIHVAKLAGVPGWVNRRAETILGRLENKPQSKSPNVGNAATSRPQEVQLTLFAAETHPLIDKIRRIDTNHVTPMAALELLNEWRRELSDEETTKPTQSS